MHTKIYEVENLQSARKYLAQLEGEILLSNAHGSASYYGMQVIDYIFTRLTKEFPEKISGIIVNTNADYSAYVTAIHLGYSGIR